jgi:SAM-dependent methyltransferase
MDQFKPIHSFPARMAPEVVLEQAKLLPSNSVVLDPMSGSGTVLRVVTEYGHKGIGFDMDPLAVLMAKVWTTPIDPKLLQDAATELVENATQVSLEECKLQWIEDDPETQGFIRYWFAEMQSADLQRLSFFLQQSQNEIGDALRLALSRIIVTSKGGASLAQDTSHSRPHRVRDTNEYAVMPGFISSANRLGSLLSKQMPSGNADIRIGDARHMPYIAASSVDCVITSPPYLNAIDYLRGHKFSLVWLGHSITELRQIRSNSIGTERGLDLNTEPFFNNLAEFLATVQTLPPRIQRIIHRYLFDIHRMLSELYRVLKSGGKAILVIGNSQIRGIFVQNSLAILRLAEQIGFEPVLVQERDIPFNRRYLPPPADGSGLEFERRMHKEIILTLRKR